MTEKDMEKIQKMCKSIHVVLCNGRNNAANRIQLTPTEDRNLDESYAAGMEMLRTCEETFNKRLEHTRKLIDRAQADTWTQEEMFDSNGRAMSNADANGKLTGPLGTKDIDQLPLDYAGEPGCEGGRVRHYPMTAVALELAKGMLQAVLDGSGKKKASELVIERGGWPAGEVEQAWGQLVNSGYLSSEPDAKGRKRWVAHPLSQEELDEHFLRQGFAPDGVIATSETPDAPLVSASAPAPAETAPAEAEASEAAAA